MIGDIEGFRRNLMIGIYLFIGLSVVTLALLVAGGLKFFGVI